MRAKFKPYPIGYFHVDLAEVRTEQGKLYLLVAIDQTSKFASAELHHKATRRSTGDFLRHFAAALPYRIHRGYSGSRTHDPNVYGTHFTVPTGDGWTLKDIKEMRAQRLPFRCHAFEPACVDLNIEHRTSNIASSSRGTLGPTARSNG